mmetsp:Transcript_18330/g.29365  ORF Transcript_18330/g.29365 Transcript_18330/m.29365 type:complete len:218 (+) Transcript_18330:493-1146(+)
MRLIVIRAVHTARTDDPRGCAGFLHRPDLHRRGMRTQHKGRTIVALRPAHVERVHLGPRGVVTRDIQSVKAVPIGVDARPFGHGKPHLGKDGRDLFAHLADRMDRTWAPRARRQCHIQPLVTQARIQRRIGKAGLLGRQSCVDLILERIERRPRHLALFRGHTPKLAHLECNLALLADGGQADVLQRGLVRGAGNLRQIFRFEIVHGLCSAQASSAE